MAELHLKMAEEAARTALRFTEAESFRSASWGSDAPWPHRSDLAHALEHTETLAAMVLNLAERVGASPLRSGILVGDTRFEGWLNEHAITDVRGSKLPVYHKQDMRDAYAAGHEEGWRDRRATALMESGQTGTDGSQKPNDATAIPRAKAGNISGSDPAGPRDDSDRSYSKPIGYVAASELNRLHSGHDANLRSAKFGPSQLDGDIPVFIEVPGLAEAAEAVAAFIGGEKDRLGRPDPGASDSMREARAKVLALATRYGVQGGHHTYLDQCSALLRAAAEIGKTL